MINSGVTKSIVSLKHLQNLSIFRKSSFKPPAAASNWETKGRELGSAGSGAEAVQGLNGSDNENIIKTQLRNLKSQGKPYVFAELTLGKKEHSGAYNIWDFCAFLSHL